MVIFATAKLLPAFVLLPDYRITSAEADLLFLHLGVWTSSPFSINSASSLEFGLELQPKPPWLHCSLALEFSSLTSRTPLRKLSSPTNWTCEIDNQPKKAPGHLHA